MTRPSDGPDLLWTPGPDALAASRLGRFMTWLGTSRGLSVDTYDELHAWSVSQADGFWGALWEYFGVRSEIPPTRALATREMPGAQWFPGTRLNYAEHVVLGGRQGAPYVQAEDHAQAGDRVGGTDETIAIYARSQTRPDTDLSFGEVIDQVARAQVVLRRLGVGPGDRVVGYLPNIPETLIAFLATAGLGAIWASCAPEFGATAVIDRFAQIQPTILLAIADYRFGETRIDRRDEVDAVRAAIPSLRHVLEVRYGEHRLPGALDWSAELAAAGPCGSPTFERVPFDHPLCVLFSSGTTGPPKAIVHGHGGILLEHLKNHAFSWDLGPGDTLQWFTTTAWMMWNTLVSALALRCAIVMIDGNPLHPDLSRQWHLAEQSGVSVMGASPGFLMACRAAHLDPTADFDLSRLKQLGVAGSPLPPEGYLWARERFGHRVLLNVGSGGTDVCTGLVQGSPLQAVWAGEISGPALGVAVTAFDPQGRPVIGELGELVITAPMPSMPIGFWGDEGGRRYRAAYFDHYPGVWRHGDWVRFLPTGSCTITGRSDSTLNRGGVRLGTAEFYSLVESLNEIDDSLVIHLEDPDGGPGELLLFVVLRSGETLSQDLRSRLARRLRHELSPRHTPDTILDVPAVPRTRTGKKLEQPIKRILRGEDPRHVLGPDVLADPTALDGFVAEARRRSTLPT